MRKFYFSLAFIAASLFGMPKANADVVKPYTLDFNKTISTSAHDFKVAPGWGHKVDSYQDYNDAYYVKYSYTSTGGRDGSGAISVEDQNNVGYGWDTHSITDLLVTPKITGKASIYVKNRTSSKGSIKFYQVTSNKGTFTKGEEITVTVPELSSSEWTKVELPEKTDAMVGIRASNVIIDDFSADQADITLAKGLKITRNSYSGNDKVDCNAEGKFTVNFKSYIENTGEVTLTNGMEGYSLSVLNYKTNVVLATIPLTKTLEPGDKDTVDITCNINYADFSSRNRIDIKENITSTSDYGFWVEPVPYKPIIKLRNKDGKIDNGKETFAWGMINASAPKSFTLTNDGAAPLNVTAVNVPDGFVSSITAPFTLAAHADSVFTIDMTCASAGIFAGDVTIKGDDADDFTFKVSGTILDPTKFFVNFEDQELPAGSYQEDQWSIAQRDYASSDNIYLLANNRQTTDDKFVTPLLKVEEGEKMSVDVARNYYGTGGDGVFLNVYYSKDRKNWTLARKITADELSNERAVSYTFSFGKLKTFIIDNIPAGNYYIGFGAGYTAIDNIYGFTRVEVAHDWMINDAKIPNTATVNNAYTVTANLKNLNNNEESADSYTATLYADNQAVATANAVAIPATTGTNFKFTYTPHKAGVTKTYIEFKNTADGYAVYSDTIDVTVNEEQATASLTIGENTGSNKNNVPVYWNYADSKAWTDNLYGPNILKRFGLKAGDQITSISYIGKASGSKTFNDIVLTSYVGMVDSTTFEAGKNFEEMPQYKIYDHQKLDIQAGQELPLVINFETPLVWDGTSAIRIMNFVDGSGKYINVNYPVDQNYQTAFVITRDISNKPSNSNLAIAEFSLKKEPAIVSGKITCGEKAVADANITLTSGDVIYNGKTDSEGAYSISVIQNDKQYAMTVTAEGYYDYADSLKDLSTSVEKNITLKQISYTVSGKVTYRKAALANATVRLTNRFNDNLSTTTDAEGNYTIENVLPNVKYLVKVTADKFVDFTIYDTLVITKDSTLADIEMVKAPIAVSGKITYRKAALANATVSLTRNDKTITATTDAEGSYKFNEVNADTNYALSVKADKFIDYTATDSVVFATDSVLNDIEMVRQTVSVSGNITWQETAVSGAEVTLKGVKTFTATTDEAGHYEINNVEPDNNYELTVAANDFETYTEKDSIAVADTLKDKNIELTATTVALTVPASGRITFSSERAIDFSKTEGIKAYVITNVEDGYVTLKEVTSVPAHTGVYIEATEGNYDLAPVAKAADVEKNLLVATDADYTIVDADLGKVWALTEDGSITAFTSKVNTTIAKGQAYLKADSDKDIIYIYKTDGVNAIRLDNTDDNTSKYNLGGQKIVKGYKGIIILNGKKVVKK